MESPELSVVIPFYNEVASCDEVISRILKELDRSDIDFEVIPVDNGSSDGTAAILKRWAESQERISLVSVPVNQGYGFGILSGLEKCRGQYLGYVDGDLQVAPGDIVRVYLAVTENGADVGKGTRSGRSDGFSRLVFSKIFNLLFKVLFGTSIKDVNAKPKILSRQSYSALTLESKDWFIDTEIIVKANREGMRTTEVPIEFSAREEGKSNVRLGAILEFIVNLIRYRLTNRI